MTSFYEDWAAKQKIKEEERAKRYETWLAERQTKVKKDDFDLTDEARERDDSDSDRYVDDAYENMMLGGE